MYEATIKVMREKETKLYIYTLAIFTYLHYLDRAEATSFPTPRWKKNWIALFRESYSSNHLQVFEISYARFVQRGLHTKLALVYIGYTMTTKRFSGDTLRGRSPSSVSPLNLWVGVV